MESESCTTLAAQSSEQCFFRAQLFYQVVQPWHIADAGLEFDMNITTGINKARFPNKLEIDAPGNEARLQEAIAAGTKVVPPESGRGDSAAIQKRLESAVTWGKEEELGYLIRACHVTENDALAALAEASSRGFETCVGVLLGAGVSGSTPVPNSSTSKNALHMACENGQEECAKLLISSCASEEEVYRPCTIGDQEITCFELLRRADLNSMARRLEAHSNSVFTK